MKEEMKYCKFCDEEKPIKEFVKSGFAIKNICKKCQNEKQKKIYSDSKKVRLLQSQLKEKEEVEKEFIKYLEAEKDRLVREVSQIYEDSLGKTKLVNEDIFNEVNNVLSKYKEIIEKK